MFDIALAMVYTMGAALGIIAVWLIAELVAMKLKERKSLMFQFNLLDIFYDAYSEFFWVALFQLCTEDWEGALFMIERTPEGRYRFDALWLAEVIRRWRYRRG